MSYRRKIGYVLFLTLLAVLAWSPSGSISQQNATLAQTALVAGRNVNMVSGMTLPYGDPWLQRQNEPSIAVSTRNPLHILAGANDYRTVDMPKTEGELPGNATNSPIAVGDAWLGVFQSVDGGQSWTSGLLPGYPQGGGTSPLYVFGYTAAADPVVRAGTNGIFYYAGVAFKRTETLTNGKSTLFLARYIDNNNTDGTPPIKYIDNHIIDSVTEGSDQFIDKPWIAVDIPNATQTVPISGTDVPAQNVAANNVYIAYTVFSGSATASPPTLKGKILFRSSEDNGATWSSAVEVSSGSDLSQGAVIAVDPGSPKKLYIAWRRFKKGNQTDAIMLATSNNGGKNFQKANEIASITPFDQGSSNYMFRSNSYPAMAVDDQGYIHIAWTARGYGQGKDSRIVVSSSNNGNKWSTPKAVDNHSGRGHQFMPSFVYTAGKLMMAWYDSRNDAAGQGTEFLDENPNNSLRHTIDVRTAIATPGSSPTFGSSIQVSRYLYGLVYENGTYSAVQWQFNPPNYPLFKGGTQPFHGDYVDLAPSPMFVLKDRKWKFNTDSTSIPFYHLAWTDNRDVRPPSGQNPDWTVYNPPNSLQPGFHQPSSCSDSNNTGMRNQNIYTASVAGGVTIGVPRNAKPLGGLGTYSQGQIPRAFVVFVRNATSDIKSFRLSIAGQPTGGTASFLEFKSLTTLDVSVAPYSEVSRPVFIASTSQNASVTVQVTEIYYPGGSAVSGGYAGSVVINPDDTNPSIPSGDSLAYKEEFIPSIINPNIINDPSNPNIINWSNPNIINPNIINPNIINPNIINPNIINPNIINPNIINPNIINWNYTNPNIINPNIINPNIINPNIINPNIINPNIINPNIINPNIINPNIINPNIINANIADVMYEVRNDGNAYSAYTLRTLTSSSIPPGIETQLFIYRVHYTPQAAILSCDLKQEPHFELVANIVNPNIINPNIINPNIINPNIINPDIQNATFNIGPGESAVVDLRVIDQKYPSGAKILATGQPFVFEDFVKSINFATTAHAVDSADVAAGETIPKFDATALFIGTPAFLPDGKIGTAYNVILSAAGGAGTSPSYTWQLNSGDLPPGLTLISSGVISGAPISATGVTYPATYRFVLEVTDGSSTNSQEFYITVYSAGTTPSLSITTATLLPNAVVDAFFGLTLEAVGGTWPRSWSLVSGTLPPGLTLDSAGAINGIPSSKLTDIFPKTYNFTLQVTDSSATPQTATKPFSLTVVANAGTVTIAGTCFDTTGNRLPGVLMHGLPDEPRTDANGFYSASVPNGWSGTVTPFYVGCTFTPASKSYGGISGGINTNQTDQNYNQPTSFTVTPTVVGGPAGGSITPVSKTGIAYNGSTTFAVTTTPGYSAAVSIGTLLEGTWTISNITANLTPTITFTAVAPVITGYAESCAAIGGNVTINGMNFGATSTDKGVALGGAGIHVDLTVISWSDTQIIAGIPNNPSITPGSSYFIGVEKSDHSMWLSNINQMISICYSPGVPYKLVFSQQPTNAYVDSVISPPITVNILDGNNNLVTTAIDTVMLAVNTGTLRGTISKAAAAGIATFDDLSIGALGSSYTLSASSGSLTPAVSNSFNIISPPEFFPDQVTDAETGTTEGMGTGDTGSLFQTFIPSVSPLAAVKLSFRAGGSFTTGTNSTINLRSGSISGPILGTATTFVYPPEVPYDPFTVKYYFHAPIVVTPGQTYVIEWLATDGAIMSWYIAESDSYSRGEALYSTGAPIIINSNRTDFIFTTYTNVLTVGHTISGFIYYSIHGLSGVTVGLYDSNPSTPLDSTTTDANGYYSFSSVADGSYQVRAVGPGSEYVGGINQPVNVSGSNVSKNIDLPKKIALLIPTNGASITDLRPTLTWEANPEATRYTIQVSRVSPWQDVEIGSSQPPQDPSQNPSYTMNNTLELGKNYQWRVGAYDSAGHNVGEAIPSFTFAESIPTYTITASAGTGGTISPSGSVSVNHGANQTFSIAASLGYSIANVTVDDVPQGAITTYTFTTVTAPHTISASFGIVVPAPEIWRSPTSLTFTAQEGGSNPAAQDLQIKNSGGGTLNYSLGESLSWLAVTPPTGTSSGETDTLQVTVIIGSLTAGSYSGTIEISAPGASNTPQTVPVTLNVTAAPALAEWVARYNFVSANRNDVPAAMVVDGSGNVIVVGESQDSTEAASHDFLIIKYSNSGVKQWEQRYDGGNEDHAKAVAVDTAGNIYVTGDSRLLPGDTSSGYDYLTISYESGGTYRWHKRYGGPGYGNDYAKALAVDPAGNYVYVTGVSAGSETTGNDFATIKYSGIDGSELWTFPDSTHAVRYHGEGGYEDEAVAVVADSGNAYVTGYNNNREIVTIKYLADGTQGWIKKHSSYGQAQGKALALDHSGHLLVAGCVYASPTTEFDIVVLKYDCDDGDLVSPFPVYFSDNDASATAQAPNALVVDAANNIYVAGSTEVYYDDMRKLNSLTLKFDSGGVLQWARKYIGSSMNSAEALAVAVDVSGNVYAAGYDFVGEVGIPDFITVKYDAAGNERWVRRYDCGDYDWEGPYADQAVAVALDSAGNVFVTGFSEGNETSYDFCTIKYSPLGPPINTVAGTGTPGYNGDTIPATSAQLSYPRGIAVDADGNIYIADSSNHRIRKVDTSGNITTYAGTGAGGYGGDGGPATAAFLNGPYGIALDWNGNLFIADMGNQRIRKVDTSGQITTVAGNGTAGFSGDGGPATSAALNKPCGVAIDSYGSIYIGDSDNHRIRRVDSDDGRITTFAGNGTAGFSGDGGPPTSASLNNPRGVFADVAGNIFIADVANNRIRKVNYSGNISTVAGNGVYDYGGNGGPALSASFRNPEGVFVDSAGNILIADTHNNQIRKVDHATGIIFGIAGYGVGFGYAGDGGPAVNALLAWPMNMALDKKGNLFICEEQNQRIRKVGNN